MTLLKAGRPLKNQSKSEAQSFKNFKEATIRMNVNIPKSFHKRLKQFALDKDMTVTDVVMKAIESWMQ